MHNIVILGYYASCNNIKVIGGRVAMHNNVSYERETGVEDSVASWKLSNPVQLCWDSREEHEIQNIEIFIG